VKEDKSKKGATMSPKEECMLLSLVWKLLGGYANVDNTFSVSTSKTVFFILSNHPVALPALLRDPATDLASITDSSLATTFSGILYKKRRKKLQGSCFWKRH
jgi:hypothetical protein